MTEITRRNFLQTCGIATIGVAFASGVAGQTMLVPSPGSLFPIPPGSMSDPLNYLTVRDFQPFVGGVFTADRAEFRLTSVIDLSVETKNAVANGTAYSLMFESAGHRRSMQSGNYRIDHPTLGRFNLLISPVNLGNAKYEAVVNRVNASAGKL